MKLEVFLFSIVALLGIGIILGSYQSDPMGFEYKLTQATSLGWITN
jgi:hypothetical protein